MVNTVADNPINTITNAPTTAEARQTGLTNSQSIDQTKTQFLQLLIAQLKNQDPLSPADTDQMTSQMMSLGQLEQLFDLNKGMTSLVNTQSSTAIATYSSMVGRQALSKGNVFQISADDKGSFNFNINEIPQTATVRVFDQYNNLVREAPVTIQGIGLQAIDFDGLDARSNQLPDGYYTYAVNALDKDGNGVMVDPYSLGTISSIKVTNGQPTFQLGNNDLGMEDIQRIF